MSGHLQENLIYLCSYLPSVSEVCRRIKVNRAQFNKYVTGAVRPSPHNMRKICDFFGVEDYELLLPPDQFKNLVGLRPSNFAENQTREDALVQAVRKLQASSNHHEMRNYVGYYYEYYYSMSDPGMILRSLLHIEHADGIAFSTRLERLEPVGSRGRGARCRYFGHVVFLADRIFLVDYETVTSNEVSQTVVFPNYKSVISHLDGLKLGVGATGGRAPAAARVTWVHLGQNPNLFALRRNIGLVSPDDPSITEDILMRIDNAQSDQPLFYTRPDYA